MARRNPQPEVERKEVLECVQQNCPDYVAKLVPVNSHQVSNFWHISNLFTSCFLYTENGRVFLAQKVLPSSAYAETNVSLF